MRAVVDDSGQDGADLLQRAGVPAAELHAARGVLERLLTVLREQAS